jgi:hypothetical protein
MNHWGPNKFHHIGLKPLSDEPFIAPSLRAGQGKKCWPLNQRDEYHQALLRGQKMEYEFSSGLCVPKLRDSVLALCLRGKKI